MELLAAPWLGEGAGGRAVNPSKRCLVLGCPNEVVRVLKHKDDPEIQAGLCAFHVRRAVLYLTPEQIDGLVFPQSQA